MPHLPETMDEVTPAWLQSVLKDHAAFRGKRITGVRRAPVGEGIGQMSVIARAELGYDGEPGPATEEALLRFQRRQNLLMTGRLDLETLGAMSLLPRRNEAVAARPFTVPKGSRFAPRVYRGIWID